jgi:hypothetical protein
MQSSELHEIINSEPVIEKEIIPWQISVRNADLPPIRQKHSVKTAAQS